MYTALKLTSILPRLCWQCESHTIISVFLCVHIEWLLSIQHLLSNNWKCVYSFGTPWPVRCKRLIPKRNSPRSRSSLACLCYLDTLDLHLCVSSLLAMVSASRGAGLPGIPEITVTLEKYQGLHTPMLSNPVMAVDLNFRSFFSMSACHMCCQV